MLISNITYLHIYIIYLYRRKPGRQGGWASLILEKRFAACLARCSSSQSRTADSLAPRAVYYLSPQSSSSVCDVGNLPSGESPELALRRRRTASGFSTVTDDSRKAGRIRFGGLSCNLAHAEASKVT